MILVRACRPRTRTHRYHLCKALWIEFTSATVNLLLLVFLLLCLLVPCSLSCTPTERDSLLVFLSNLSSTSTTKAGTFPSWDAERYGDCCSWDGISCDVLGSVTGLSLPLRGLKGPISAAALRGLPSLRNLNLSRNSFTGDLDPSLMWKAGLVVLDISFNRLDGQVVRTVPQLPKPAEPLRLQTVDLSSNHFFGPLLPSAWWASAPDLTIVNASNNGFTGSIPYSVCAANRLQTLDLSYNKLDGSVPSGFGNCSLLKLLRIGNNNLTGQVPADLYSAISLKELSAQANIIFGNLDTQGTIANLVNLSLLDFSYNKLTGPVPKGIGKLANLEVLMLNNNQLNGSLPLSLSNCSNLRLLNLRENGLTGELSAVNFSKLSELRTLDLGFNNFTGTLPPTIYSCKSLVALRLAKNNLKGRIEPGLAGLQDLSFISFSINKMSNVNSTFKILQQIKNLRAVLLDENFHEESMPQDVKGFENLRIFSLGRSNLKGHFPIWLPKLSNLAYVYLSGNQLTGTVPDSLGSLPYLFSLDLSNNSFSGEFPLHLTTLPALTSKHAATTASQLLLELPLFTKAYQYNGSGLQYNQLFNMPPKLNLSWNSLTGVIPQEIGLLKMLQVLDLSHNNFSGNIPSEIGNLAHLEMLDLSYNRLQGRIPKEMSNLSFLSHFNVNHNELWGPIPHGGQLSTFNVFSFEGNSGLCANDMAPLRPCTDAEPGYLTTRKHTHKKLLVALTLAICFSGGFVIVLLIFFMLSSRRTKIAERLNSQQEAGIISNRSMHCFPDNGKVLCGPVILFRTNCQMESLTISEILHATNNFDEKNIIGCGGFGLVYKCTLPDGTKLAIKKLIGDTGVMEREFKAEVEALSTARHENIVSLQGYFMHGNFRLLIYSLMENGSLDDWLHVKADGPSVLNWPLRLHIAQEASHGLSYIHQICNPHIVHRDIKSSNILLDHDFRAHIADFGLSRLILPTNTHVTTELVGTLGYIPPEYGQAWMATLRGDIYSFGVVLLELLTGRRSYDVFSDIQDGELVGWVEEMRNLGKQDEVFDPLLRGDGIQEQMNRVLDIACLCVSLNPLKRPVIQEVVFWLQHVDTTKEEPNS